MNKKMTEAAGKVVGKAHGAAATLKGDRGIFRLLQEEHAEVATLMKRTSMSTDPKTRRELFGTIRAELLSHAKAEETEFYPLLKQHAETAQLEHRSETEHDQMERLLEELSAMDFASRAWAERFEQLVKTVEKHVQEEEHQVFPKAKAFIDHEHADRVERAFRDVKHQVMQQYAP